MGGGIPVAYIICLYLPVKGMKMYMGIDLYHELRMLGMIFQQLHAMLG